MYYSRDLPLRGRGGAVQLFVRPAPRQARVRTSRGEEIESGNRPRTATPLPVGNGDQDGRAMDPLDDPRGDDPDHTRVPPLPLQHDPEIFGGVERPPQLVERLSQRPCFFLTPQVVCVLETVGKRRRVGLVVRHQQLQRGHRLLHSPSGVDAWGDAEPDLTGIDRSVSESGSRHESPQARQLRSSQRFEPVTNQRTVLLIKWHHICNRGKRDEVERRIQLLLVDSFFSHESFTQPIRHPGATETLVRISAIDPIRIDDRERRRERLSRRMVIRHDDIEASSVRISHSVVGPNPGVDRDDQVRPGCLRRADAGSPEIVAVMQTMRHEGDRVPS